MRLRVPLRARARARAGAACLLSLSLPLSACFIDDVVPEFDVDGGADASEDASLDAAPDASDASTPMCTAAAECDDHNPCTVDACTDGACAHTDAPQGTSCDDGDACNGVSTCDGSGHCASGTPPVLDDGNPCTADACDTATGTVTHTPTPACAAPITETSAPLAREQHTAVWTGTRMLVWGGLVAGSPNVTATGGSYDPVADAWSPLTMTGAPPPRHSHCAVWTGTRMLVWGGYGLTSYETTGGSYDPAADAWSPLSTVNAPPGRTGFSCAWTGSKLVVWGGSTGPVTATGGSYDPASDMWTTLPATGEPSARYNHSAVWTGSRMIVWGGNDLGDWHRDGVNYDPTANAWTGAIAITGAPSAREQHSALWTGANMLVWGGFSGGPYLGDGGSFDPSAAGGGAWTAISVTGAPSARTQHAAVWTGTSMIIWAGCGTDSCAQLYGDGGVWTPDASGGTWKPIAASASLSARRGPTAVWTGKVMALWGGRTKTGSTDTGAVYYP